MADLTPKIQLIEEKLQGLGLLTPAQVDGVADEAFVDARDKAVRFLAAFLDMPGVTGYTPEFGRQVLDRLAANEKSGKLAEDIESIKENSDLELDKSWTPTKSVIRGYLEDAGIPEDQWGKIKLGGLLAFIKDRKQVVADLNEIANDKGVQQVQKARVEKTQSDTETVLKTIGQEGKAWDAPETQAALKEYVTKLQSDFGFPEARRYGAFDEVTSKKLTQQLAAGPVPAGYDAAQLQAFIPALDALRSSGAYNPPEKPLTAFDATLKVEAMLGELVPKLNAQLEEKNAQMPGGFMGQLLKDFITGGILDRRITEVGEPDGIFDMRTQASLQGMMLVLSHPMLLEIPAEKGVGDHEYTVTKGKYIREHFEEKLKGKISDEQLADLKKVLPELLDSLDYLAKEGMISHELFINPDNSILSMPDLVERQFAQRIEEHKDGNPDMLRLLDSLTHTYTNSMGMAALMPDLAIPDLFGKIDASKSPRDRLAQFYKEAREKYGDKEDNFHTDMIILINTAMTLPYGNRAYREHFEDAMSDALAEAGKISDPDAAAKMFADKVSTYAVELHKTQEGGAPAYVESYDRSVPVWKPGLTSLEITSGGHAYNSTDIAQAYDDYNLAVAQGDFQKRGMANPLYQQKFMIFQDDEGQRYVAGIDKDSMIFTVEKIDVAAIRKALKDKPGRPWTEIRDLDPGFALLVDQRGHIQNGSYSYSNLLVDVESEDVPKLGDFVQKYRKEAQDIHAGNIQRLNDEAQWNPDLFIPKEPAPQQFKSAARRAGAAEFDKAAALPSSEDLQLISQFTSRKLYSSPVVLGPRDRDVLEAFSRNAGRELTLGSSIEAGTQVRIKGIEMPSDTSGPLIALYDRKEQRVRVIETPQVLRDSAARKALMEEVHKTDDMTMMDKIRREQPELFALMNGYSAKGAERAVLSAGDTSQPYQYLGFRREFLRFMKGVELQSNLSVSSRPPVYLSNEQYRVEMGRPNRSENAMEALGSSMKRGFSSAVEGIKRVFGVGASEKPDQSVQKTREIQENGREIAGDRAGQQSLPLREPAPVYDLSRPLE